MGLLFYRKIDSTVYVRVPSTPGINKWVKIYKMTDTMSLSNRINQKLNISDTASMLSKYLRKVDTASLSQRINGKLNITDTAAMLSPYLRKIDTASLSIRINAKLNISDTMSMLSPYFRKADTLKFHSGSNTSIVQNGRDITISSSGGGGAGDSVWVGTVSQLATLNDINIKSATTTDFGGGSWYVDAGDVTSVTNWGNLIVDALSRRWKRIYTGYDELRWYYANPGTDSAVIQRAYNSCKDGLFINNGLYTNLNLIRFNRDGINVTGESKTKTILKQLGTPTTLSCLLFFQDVSDLNINNVTISNMTLDGNGINQTGTNASIIRQGSGSLDTVKNITFRDVIILIS